MVPPTLRVDLPFSVNIDKNTAENPSRTCPEVCSHDSKSYQVDDQDKSPRVKHMKSFKNNKLIRTLKRCTQDSDPAGDHPELNKHAIILSSDWPLWVKSRTLSPSITEHFELVVFWMAHSKETGVSSSFPEVQLYIEDCVFQKLFLCFRIWALWMRWLRPLLLSPLLLSPFSFLPFHWINHIQTQKKNET